MVRVAPAETSERLHALSLLFSAYSAEARKGRVRALLQAAERGHVSLDGLLLAKRNGRSCGAALYDVQPDQGASIWPPGVRRPQWFDAVGEALMQPLCRQMDQAGVRLGQALLERHQTAEESLLRRHGFAPLTELCFLDRSLELPLPAEDLSELEWVSYDPANDNERLAQLVERTYIGTCDCAALNGWRTGEQALQTHCRTGRFDPALWTIHRRGKTDVGVLLLADHPEQNAWEVVYMGIVPEARGRRLGRAMLLRSLRWARQAGRRRMYLAVDDKNHYAKTIYEGLGFTVFDRQRALVRPGRGQ